MTLEICPDFLKVKPPKHKFFRSIKVLQKSIVTKALKTTVNELVELKNELYKTRTILNQRLSVLELHKLNKIVCNIIYKKENIVLATHTSEELTVF